MQLPDRSRRRPGDGSSRLPRNLTPGRGGRETLPSMDRTGGRRGARTSSGHVVPFPPLARTPPPPRSRFDPRQANVARVVGALLDAVGSSAGARPTNLTGFRASAVDVGRVKAILEAGIAAFDMHQVKARWKRDVRAWMVGTVRAWVQRCKLIRLRPREAGIRVELQTQDDEGYYDYGFDVFPRRRRARPLRRRPTRARRATGRSSGTARRRRSN